MGNLAGLFIKRENKIANIFVDTFITEFHRRQIKVTEFPTEIGININDHRIILPAELRIQGLVSNVVTPTTNENILSGSDETRATSTYLQFIELLTAGEKIDIQTGLVSYKDMVLVSIDVERDYQTSGALFFDARFQELITVATGSSFIDGSQYEEGKTREQATPINDSGRQSSENIDEASTEANINLIKSAGSDD